LYRSSAADFREVQCLSADSFSVLGFVLKAINLECRTSPKTHLFRQIERSVLLYMSSVERHSYNLQAKAIRDLNRTQFGSVEAPPYLFERTNQCSMGGSLKRSAKCPGRVRIHHPHKVPAKGADPGIELCYQYPRRLCPAFTKRLMAQMESVWQDATFTQEYRVLLHAFRLLGIAITWFLEVTAAIGAGIAGPFEEECSSEKSLLNSEAFAAALTESISEYPVASGSVTGWTAANLMARLAAKCLGTSIFLVRFIAAPFVLLLA
jgi:hypothetical protein